PAQLGHLEGRRERPRLDAVRLGVELADGGEPGAVAAERQCLGVGGEAAEAGLELAGRRVPEADVAGLLLEAVGRGERLAVAGEGERAYAGLVPGQHGTLPERAQVPQPGGAVETAGGERVAVGRNGDGEYHRLVAGERGALRAGGHVPQLDLAGRLAVVPLA